MKRYSLALLGLILFSSGLCVFGEALISKYENTIGFLLEHLINFNQCWSWLMIKNKGEHFNFSVIIQT